MLKAYNKLKNTKKRVALPVYVNFKSSLKLEPLYRNNSNAAYWFNQWLLIKVLQGVYETLRHLKLTIILFTCPSPQIDKEIRIC